jgi:hypothetical protein
MKPLSNDNTYIPILRLGIMLLALLFLIAIFALPISAIADAGGWPTATPTITQTLAPPTPTNIPTPIPTSPFLTFPPTPTFTPVVPALSAELAAPELRAQGQAVQSTSRLGLNWWTCLPFAIVFVGLGVVGVLWLRTRMRVPGP